MVDTLLFDQKVMSLKYTSTDEFANELVGPIKSFPLYREDRANALLPHLMRALVTMRIGSSSSGLAGYDCDDRLRPVEKLRRCAPSTDVISTSSRCILGPINIIVPLICKNVVEAQKTQRKQIASINKDRCTTRGAGAGARRSPAGEKQREWECVVKRRKELRRAQGLVSKDTQVSMIEKWLVPAQPRRERTTILETRHRSLYTQSRLKAISKFNRRRANKFHVDFCFFVVVVDKNIVFHCTYPVRRRALRKDSGVTKRIRLQGPMRLRRRVSDRTAAAQGLPLKKAGQGRHGLRHSQINR
ncbi:hypothetical protein EVAR_31794_1 [Eumeta japonica]|uniref:Uncharacterized protein n=1 Tax=Eumeta variegata TaxID=151549 RepID=A0A4C1W715_EUMVA|nr:hypothetical protein EVAR_31794_1 [Eumeta japonica]